MVSGGIAELLGVNRAELLAACEANRSRVLASLPHAAAEIVAVTSFHSLFVLVDNLGGTFCHVPKAADREWQVVTLIGQRQTRKLIESFGAGRIELPAKRAIAQSLRPFVVKGLRLGGESVAKIARRTGTHQRTVWRDLQKLRGTA